MKKNLILIMLACSLCLIPGFAQSSPISNGTAWLFANQNSDGSWGKQANLSLIDTAEVLNSLKSVSSTDTDYLGGITWLSSQEITSTDELARKIISLASAGLDTSTLVDALAGYKNPDGGWGFKTGNQSEPFDTALALQALKSANFSDFTLIGQSLNYLTTHQNPDGGWGFVDGNQESDTYHTAMVLDTLSLYKSTFIYQTQLTSAVNYLLSKQNPDGGFGSSPSTVYETALSLIALIESGQGQAQPLQNAINYITTTQLADGSWNDDPYSTALALRALAYVKPNLNIAASDILFSKPMPQAGEIITITANIRNTGLDSASNVIVRFFSGDPASGGTQMGTDQIIPLLAAGSSAQVSVNQAFATTGSKTIYVQVDPANQISETSKADNLSSARLWIATPPDLAVFSEDIKPSTYTPVSGTAFTLDYTVRNIGESAAGGFDVALYDGQPTGLPLQTIHLSGLNGTEVRTGTFGVTLTSDGAHTLYVVADSGNLITEASKTNNTGTVTVQVGGVQALADIAVTPMDITLTPSRPTANQSIQIAAHVRNQGIEPANNFTVEIFDGAPEAGGTLIQSATRTLAAGADQIVTTNWTIPTGIHDIYLIADSSNQIIETNETNNRASVRVMTDMVDVALSATDLTFNPSHPVSGDAVALTMTVHNQGIKNTGAFNLTLYNGDPNGVGAPPATPLQTFPIANIPGDGSATLTYTFTASPQTYRFYAVADMENIVAEMYEDNNTAIRSLKIKALGEILGPDLVPVKIDLTGTTTDPQTLAISGTAHITLQNKGDAKITTPFSVPIFEDTDLDGRYTQGVDTLLGTGANTLTLWPEGANMVDVPVSGTVKFLHSPLYAMVDSGDAILEQDETNNLLVSCKDCQVVPANQIQNDIEVKWRWKQPSTMFGYVYAPPAIVNLTDDNNDGRIDEKDIPAIAFVMAHENYNLMANYHFGRLWALRGDTGTPMFTYYDFNHAPSLESAVAAADIDSDGKPEIILAGRSSGSYLGAGGVLALRNDGTLKWDNYVQAKAWTNQGPTYYGYVHESGMPSIADIDSDGKPEIIFGKTAINRDGSIKWGRNYYGTTGTGTANGIIQSSQVVDLDLDGKQEVVAGFTAYNSDGSIRWSHPEYTDGITAVGNLDDDIYPEIVLVTNYVGRALVHLLDHDGQRRWGPVDLKTLNLPDINFAGYGSPPVIADFDGDGQQEIGITGNGKYFILDKNGNLKRTLSIPGYNAQPIAATVFDINGDGRPEVMIHTSGHFRIFDGQTGQMLFEDSFGAGSMRYQSVLIADVNGDNLAEIVVIGFDSSSDTVKARDGIRVYGSKSNDWINARRIWNQAGYHVTNVNDDGSIPQYEAPSWLLNNTYHTQAAIGQNPNPYLTPNLTASYLRAEQAGSSVNLTVRIGNGGAKEAQAGATVTFYDGDPATGAIIGTAATTRILQPGEYQDLIYSWTGGGTALHHIYAVVDAANTISECREDDNQAQLDITVQIGLPDLKVAMEDIIIPTAPVTEGSIVPINVTVHNIGSVTASNIVVRLANGIGVAWIDQPQTIATISSGGTSTVTFNFDTLGHAGTNILYVSVDPDNTVIESTKSNNTASVTINVQPPQVPNFVVSSDGIQISPVLPQEGNQVTITASISNRGSAVGNIPVRFSLGDPTAGGTTIAMPVIYPMLSLGQSAQVQAVLDSTGWAGQQTVSVIIDPQNTIVESSKSDNTASKALFIQSGGMTETVLLDKPSYQANDMVTATITAANATANTRSLLMNVSIKDSAGNLIANVSSSDAVTVSPNSSVTLVRTWNTGKTLSGSYMLFAELIDAGSAIARKAVNFTIAADMNISASVTTGKVSYNPNESAAVTSVITSQSANYIFSGLTASISIGNPVGGGQLYADTKTITTLIPGAAYTFKTYWDTGTYPAGTYPITIEVKDATGAIIATGMQNLTITSTLKPSSLLKGQISVDKQSLLSGETATVSYNVTNVGNTDLLGVTFAVLTAHVVDQTVYDSLTYQAALLMGGSYANTGQIDTSKYTAKDYLVILRATINGTEATLAGTYFRVEGAPSAPSLSGPVNGSDVLTFTPALSVNNAADPNDDSLTYQFELYSDSVLTDLVSSSDLLQEAAGMTAWTVPISLAENQIYYWRARAYDGWLYGAWMTPASFRVNTVNDPPSAPTVSSPADGTAVSSFIPILTVSNAADPDSDNLTYNFDLALDSDFTQIAASTRGVSSGNGTTSWQVPATLQENTLYYWRSQADDWFMEGPWSTTSSFFVNTVNDAPTAPVITAPANNSVVTQLSTDITVTNSTDPDSPLISYFFEVDTVPTFDSPNIIRSGVIAQGQATTIWHVTGLQEDTQYYARAKASDGTADSPWSAVVGFFANTVNDPPTAPTLANPSNGAGVNALMPTLSVHNSTDPDRDVLNYEFEIYSDAALTTLVTGTTSVPETTQITSWTVPVALNENATYYWRSRAFDGALTSVWMPAASFMVNTANDVPGAPKLSSPTDGSSIATLTPTLAVVNAIDPDSDKLVYDFEVYSNGTLAASITGVPEDASGITSVTPGTSLMDNTVYQWRARAFDGDRYGPWMSMATFSVHIPTTNINATIDFDPDTLNKMSKGNWVVVYIELPVGYKPNDIDISSIRLEGIIPAEIWPYGFGDHDKDGVPDLMVKFKRSDVISLLPNDDRVTVHVNGKVGSTTFEGIDVIRVIP